MASLPDAALLLDQIPAGIGPPFHALDRDIRFVPFNDEAARHPERPVDRRPGRTVRDLFPGDVDHERRHLPRKGMANRQVMQGGAPKVPAGH